MKPLYEITGGRGELIGSLAAILVWQGMIGLAEELYYRGAVQVSRCINTGPMRCAFTCVLCGRWSSRPHRNGSIRGLPVLRSGSREADAGGREVYAWRPQHVRFLALLSQFASGREPFPSYSLSDPRPISPQPRLAYTSNADSHSDAGLGNRHSPSWD